MFEDNSKEVLEKLGFCIDKNGCITKLAKINKGSSSSYVYCGLNTYLDRNNYNLFEKVGEELVPLQYEEIDAETRFINRHLAKEGL